jgi:hypothetical protein
LVVQDWSVQSFRDCCDFLITIAPASLFVPFS